MRNNIFFDDMRAVIMAHRIYRFTILRPSKSRLLFLCLAFVLLFSPAISFSAAQTTIGVINSVHTTPLLQVYPAVPVGGTIGSSSLPLDRNASRSASDDWHSYPIYGGKMTSMAIDPSDSETVYVGTRDAGVFKTTDGGQSWQPARTGLTFYPIRSLEVDPQHPNTLYAGTDFDGIWKTTDGGNSWNKSGRGLAEDLIVFNIVIDPQNTNTLYAGLAGGLGLVIGNIYKSENGGATWEVKDDGIPRYEGRSRPNAIYSLVIDPANSSLLYAGTHFHGAFKSTNGGGMWNAINDGLPFWDSTKYLGRVNALAIDPHHSNRLSAIINGEYYVFENKSWQKVSMGTRSYEKPNSIIALGYLYFHPTDPAIIYSAGSRFTKSTDAGINWTSSLGWPDSGEIPEIAFHQSSPNTIYAVSDTQSQYLGGVYKSNDQGDTWTQSSQGITAVNIHSVAIDPLNSNTIYAGTGDSGCFFRTLDGGMTWSRGYRYSTHNGVQYDIRYFFGSRGIRDIAVDYLNPQNIYIAATDFYRSTNQGETFQEVDDVEEPECIAIAPNASSPIYVGCRSGRGIYKSSDDGLTWMQKNQGLPMFGNSINPILSLAIDPTNVSTVWAGTEFRGGIVKSTDSGEHWQVKGLTNETPVEAIAVNPNNSNEILAGGSRVGEGRIYKSTDGGNSWHLKLSGIAQVQDFVFDPRNPCWIYAATEGYGVLRSFDGGETWYDYSAGIFYPKLYSLAITEEDSPLLITGSYGSGLYWTHPSSPE